MPSADLEDAQPQRRRQTSRRRPVEVLSIPTLILFKDGGIAKKVVGAMPKGASRAELEPALAVGD